MAGIDKEDTPRGQRLQKLLASAGLGSRRYCEQLIAERRVTVNGQVARLGQRADSAVDRIGVDGIPLPVREGTVYYLLNKPVGVVTSASDPEGRPTVVDLVPGAPRVFPVGRLDIMSEGLLVLTNDGELAYQLTHPSFGVEKEYVVEVEGRLSRETVGRLRRGVELDDGLTAAARVSSLGPTRYASPSTKGATGRCAACAKRSATRYAAWCGPGSGRFGPGTGARAVAPPHYLRGPRPLGSGGRPPPPGGGGQEPNRP